MNAALQLLAGCPSFPRSKGDHESIGLLIGILIIFAGYWLNKRLERLKGALALENAMSPQRTAAYAKLWHMTAPLSPRESVELEPEGRAELLKTLRKWYYDEGNAMYLSLDAADLFLKGLDILKDGLEDSGRFDPEETKTKFSTLRTQLKVDLGVYTKTDAKVKIPRVS